MKTYSKNTTGELLEVNTQETSHTYTLEYLNEQKKQIEASLVAVNNLIVEAQKAGVVLESPKIL